MSDILIRGMEMPKDENSFLKIVIFSDGRCFVAVGDNEITSKTGEVTAQELPPHGGLIDVETLGEALWAQRMQYQMLDDTHTADKIMHGIYRAEQIIKKIKPVVPASE